MSAKKNEKIDLEKIKPEEELKYEIASELGYLDKVMSTGWKSLTAKESGRIGGLMSKIKKEQVKKEDNVSKEEGGN
ncbi:MAG TPA: small, acid-soluble spore protein, alpha/beta type [Mobilitalea sp.]|nr:small, acid-soluble spore protein, alpha/beta type [Mobilitalea sp.]